MGPKMMAFGAMSATVAGGAFMLGSPDRGEYYEMAPQDVAAMLATAETTSFTGDLREDGALSFTSHRLGDEEVVWNIAIAGEPFADFTAELEPEGKGTRVTVQFEFADNELGDAIRSDMGDADEMVGAMVRLGMLEHVDATLERRPFDSKRLDRDLAAYAIKNPSAIANFKKRKAEFEKLGETPKILRALESRMETDMQWHGRDPYDPTMPVDRADGYNPNSGAQEPGGFDPSGDSDYGQGEEPMPTTW